MKHEIRRATTVIAVLCLVIGAGQLAAADKSWEDLDKQAKQAKIDETAKESLDEVFKGNKAAKELYNNSYGWAAFDNLKIAWGFSGGGGNGVSGSGSVRRSTRSSSCSRTRRPSATSSTTAGRPMPRPRPPPEPRAWAARQASSTELRFTRSRTKG
jgi:hypothetical protein